MDYRNARFLADGRIDCEINHPAYGWIPFTAAAGDVGTLFDVAALHAEMAADPATVAYVAAAPAPPVPRTLNKTQWSFLLDMTAFRDAVDAALSALPKATPQERATWAGMKAVAYESPDFSQHVTLALAAQIRAMGIPGLTVPTDAEIIAAWPLAEAFQGAASLGVTP